MRTHLDIIEAVKGPTKLARAIGADPNTAKAWKRNASIPAPYWAEIARQKIASLEELAAGAEMRRPDLAA
jgi:hypothetical protein